MQRKYAIMLSLAVAMLVCVFTFSIYKLVLGSPPISLPVVNYTVSNGELYDLLQKIEAEEATITWNTNGEITALADGKKLAAISYDLDSLGKTIDLVEKMAVPESSRWMVDTTKFLTTPLRRHIIATNSFFYHIVPVKFSFSIKTG